MVRTFISMLSIPTTWEYVWNNICQNFPNQTFVAKLKCLDDASLHQGKFNKLVIAMNTKGNHALHLYLKSKQRSHVFKRVLKNIISRMKKYHCNAFITYTIHIKITADRPDKAIVLLLTNMENYKEYVLLRLQYLITYIIRKVHDLSYAPWSSFSYFHIKHEYLSVVLSSK